MNVRALVLGFLVFAIFAVSAAPARAADVDGTWTGMVNTPNGDIPVAFTFKADGAALTGTTTGMDGKDVPIANGKIDGKNISFSVTLDFGGMPFEISYKGVVSPAEITLSGDAGGFAFEFVVKKAS
jgi:hypothetical protein